MRGTSDRPTGVAIVHLMKTGGTSVYIALRPRFESFECYPKPGAAAVASGQKVNPDQLLNLPDDERAALRFVSVHMPAWVVGAAVPHLPTATMLRDPVGRCISHLRQLARMSRAGHTLDELWENPPIRRRLSNYQTQVFAATAAEFHNRLKLTQALTGLSDDQKAELFGEVRAAKETGVDRVIDVDETSLLSAKARLETIDVVGITNDLNGFSTRLAARTQLSTPSIGHQNRATDDITASAALRARIAAGNQLDLELYEHASTLT